MTDLVDGERTAAQQYWERNCIDCQHWKAETFYVGVGRTCQHPDCPDRNKKKLAIDGTDCRFFEEKKRREP